MSEDAKPIYKFGAFRLDTAERLLLRSGKPVPLTEKCFETLLVLVENSGRVVKKDELMRIVWSNTFVEEANLAQNVFKLRKALGEDPKRNRPYIETVARRGYRFAATVKRILNENHAPVRARAAETPSLGAEDNFRSPAIPSNSLAVLPLINTSDDPKMEYLSDGITESIINTLSQIPHLKVMARNTVFRYKGQEVSAQAVGKELNVGAVLVGRELQISRRLIISVELVNVADGAQLWGERYNRNFSDILAVQEEISREVSEKLRLKLTNEERRQLSKRHTENTEAYQLYLRGRYFWNKYRAASLKRAIGYFQKAIDLDPSYALAYAGLSDAYYRLSNLRLSPKSALPKAKAMAIKAVELDDLLAEAHSSLGVIKIYWDHDFKMAEKEHARAIELNPGNALAHQRLGICLLYVGRFREALSALAKALELDPLSLQINVSLATCLVFMGEYDQAIAQARKALELDRRHASAHLALGFAHIYKGDLDKAISELRRALRFTTDYHALGLMGYAYALFGERIKAERVIGELREASKRRYVSPYHMATIYSGLGEKDQAFAWLEQLYSNQDEYLTWIKTSPELRDLRLDPRFTALLRRVGFTS